MSDSLLRAKTNSIIRTLQFNLAFHKINKLIKYLKF